MEEHPLFGGKPRIGSLSFAERWLDRWVTRIAAEFIAKLTIVDLGDRTNDKTNGVTTITNRHHHQGKP